MGKKYIVANWKSNKTRDDVLRWLDDFKSYYKVVAGEEVIIAPAFVFLVSAKDKLLELGMEHVSLASQDVSEFPFGAYTGAVTASMLGDVVSYAIVGHSERRKYFGESHNDVANKVIQLRDNGIRPIVCVDEPYAGQQIAAIGGDNMSDLIVAYEPLEAIGSGHPQEPEHVAEVVEKIAKIVPGVPILYGGSVNVDNAHLYLHVEGVSGLLVGGASLDAQKFAKLSGRAI